MSSPTPRSEVYYRWVDAEGRVHLVSSIDAVPAALRSRVERLELGVREPPAPERAASSAFPDAGTLLVAGAAIGVTLIVASRLFPNGLRWLAKVGAIALVVAVLGAVYLGALRHSVGTGEATLATPAELIGDAKRSVESMKQRQKLQEEELRRIQSEAH